MKEKTINNIVLALFQLVSVFVAFMLVDWRVVAAIWLMIFANNIGDKVYDRI